ncbi:protein of unknown function [Bartonella clarridgeiae 73]|uniref:Uncharacterized protein n=1 Tax=Bartonella clarridgeiae (strain CCUG 45776 / CIP 104772 / 73) TaxID=696125 RepID=E6YH04_BARC7|nr:protein of unknown function [Bartonella clarridgeiae 73]
MVEYDAYLVCQIGKLISLCQ